MESVLECMFELFLAASCGENKVAMVIYCGTHLKVPEWSVSISWKNFCSF